MKIPERYLPLCDSLLQGVVDPSGKIMKWPTAFGHVYPPPGFLEIPGLFELGNGDVHGFYWPIGRENADPILCETWHDDHTLRPDASSLEGLVRLRSQEDRGDGEEQLIADRLGFEVPDPGEDTSSISPDERLEIDPASPTALVDAAKIATQENKLEQAESLLLRAINVLPEYTEAISMLAWLYRRMRRDREAAERAVEAIGSPLAFGPLKRLETLNWLKRLKDDAFPNLAEDPLWRERHQLTFETGEKTSGDFEVYERAVQTYLEQGRGDRAVRLRILIGELIWAEATPFRERMGYTLEVHLARLRENLARGGFERRLESLSSVITHE